MTNEMSEERFYEVNSNGFQYIKEYAFEFVRNPEDFANVYIELVPELPPHDIAFIICKHKFEELRKEFKDIDTYFMVKSKYKTDIKRPIKYDEISEEGEGYVYKTKYPVKEAGKIAPREMSEERFYEVNSKGFNYIKEYAFEFVRDPEDDDFVDGRLSNVYIELEPDFPSHEEAFLVCKHRFEELRKEFKDIDTYFMVKSKYKTDRRRITYDEISEEKEGYVYTTKYQLEEADEIAQSSYKLGRATINADEYGSWELLFKSKSKKSKSKKSKSKKSKSKKSKSKKSKSKKSKSKSMSRRTKINARLRDVF